MKMHLKLEMDTEKPWSYITLAEPMELSINTVGVVSLEISVELEPEDKRHEVA